MKRTTPLLGFALFLSHLLIAEGTRELAPNGSIDVMGNNTTDLAALHVNHPSYNNFASYTNPDPHSRLYIHIKDPATECIYLGFSFAHANVSVPNPTPEPFQFRIKDPNGNIVFGPVFLNPAEVNIHSWAEGFAGPMQVVGAGGYDALQANSAALSSQGWSGAGDYYIEFQDEDLNDMLIDFWDITVADCAGGSPVEKKGRVWSYNWSIFAVNDFGFPNRPFNGAFYVCAPDPDNEHASFITKIDFNGSGFRPAAFNIAFNSFGCMNTGNVMQDRRSVWNANSTQSEYSIFLNDPIEICETAEIGQIELLGVTRCAANDYCIKFIASKAGQVDLLLDFDGMDNIYTPGSADLMIAQTVTADQVGKPVCLDWNGRDGLGNLIPESSSTQIPVTIAYAQGIYHFPIYDAELMTTGVTIAAVRPAAPIPLLYYDDSDILVPSGSGEPAMQLSGCVAPCHQWTNFTNPNTTGFGNFCTINTWWFSQLIIRQDVFLMPGYYTCGITGPQSFCQGSTSSLSYTSELIPADSPELDVISILWSGPGIVGPPNESSIQIDQPGEYTFEMSWLTQLGDTCSSSCSYHVTQDPPLTNSIDTLILFGETVVINGESYSEGGVYTQLLSTSEGCDSILTITVKVINSVVHYDLNACEAFMSDGSHMDYSEFQPAYPEPLSCAELTGSIFHRTPPDVNKHSCTPGVNNSVAMCISSLDTCSYEGVEGHEASLVLTLTVEPDPDTAVQVTGISFYAQAPDTYNWISGGSGPNNYPTLYAIRVLKNGTEVFRSPDIATTPAWALQTFDFSDNKEFIVEEAATFTVEILPYCLVGNGADVAAWDVDEVNIQASCVSPAELDPLISGIVKTVAGQTLSDVEVRLATQSDFSLFSKTNTDVDGQYVFEKVRRYRNYYLQGYKNDDVTNGVSTLDIIYILKHLLGIQPLTSPYQWLAADVNQSHSISVLDLVEIRKVILGINSHFPKTSSWRFGDARQMLTMDQPWELQEMIPIEYFTQEVRDADFTAVKMGDVNGDVVAPLNDVAVTNRSAHTFPLVILDQELEASQWITIPVYAGATSDLAGLQLAFDLKGVEFGDISANAIPLEMPDYYLAPDKTLRISWAGEQKFIAEGEILFTLLVRNPTPGWIYQWMEIDPQTLAPQAYVDEELNIHDVKLSFRLNPQQETRDVIHNILPNPTTGFAQLHVELAEEGPIEIRMFNYAGGFLGKIQKEGKKGFNDILIDFGAMNLRNGMVVCHIQTSRTTRAQKIVVLD